MYPKNILFNFEKRSTGLPYKLLSTQSAPMSRPSAVRKAYRYVTMTRTGREQQKCPSYSGFRVIETQFSQQAGFRRPIFVRDILDSEL